jgi:TPR repeat protein
MPLCAFLLGGCATPSGPQLASTFDSGVKAYDAGDYPAAYKIWSGIDDEDLAAMRNVAMMLRTGQGVAKDPKKAEDMYEIAAEAGLPTAQADLADMLLKGEAGPPDPKRALPLLEAASAANHPLAQYELAQMYETGQDGLVPKDMTVARRLYAAAATHGMKEAQARLDQLGPDTPAPALRLMQPVPPATAQVQPQKPPAQEAPTEQAPTQQASGQTPGPVTLRPAQP